MPDPAFFERWTVVRGDGSDGAYPRVMDGSDWGLTNRKVDPDYDGDMYVSARGSNSTRGSGNFPQALHSVVGRLHQAKNGITSGKITAEMLAPYVQTPEEQAAFAAYVAPIRLPAQE